MTLLIFAAFFAVLGIVCILIPFHIGMTGICLLLLAAVLAALWLLTLWLKVWKRRARPLVRFWLFPLLLVPS